MSCMYAPFCRGEDSEYVEFLAVTVVAARSVCLL